MRKVALLTVLFGALLALAGAVGPVAADNNGSYIATLSGSEEVPPVDTHAVGVAHFKLSDDGLSMTYKLNTSNIRNVTAGHIHSNVVGMNGPVVVNLVSPAACRTLNNAIRCEGTFTAADLRGPLLGRPLSELIAIMDNGGAYVNVHTMLNPGGETRGQIR
jgi:hypothetical protein